MGFSGDELRAVAQRRQTQLTTPPEIVEPAASPESIKDPWRQPMSFSYALKVFGGGLIIMLCIGMLFTYGTLSPCGALKQAMRSQFMRVAMQNANGSTAETAGIGLSGADDD